MSRSRFRSGRSVSYLPTDSEATTYGEGPYSARITAVNSDGTVNLSVDVPSAFVESGTIDGTYAQSPEGDALEELRARENLRYKASVAQGSTPGTFSFAAGPQAL